MPNDLLAAEIRAELARQRLSQQDLAKRLSRSQPWVSRRLTGEVEITVTELHEIAAALSVPVSRLLADEPV